MRTPTRTPTRTSTRTSVSARRGARRAANSSAAGTAARWGLVAYGVVHLLIGLLALRVALGDPERQADSGGALRELARQPFGQALVWAVGVGLAALALWRLSEAFLGAARPGGRRPKERLRSAARSAVLAVLSASAITLAVGSGSGGSTDERSRDLTARVLDLPAGRWLVGAAGLAVIGVGVWSGVRALRHAYREELGPVSARVRRVVDVLGVTGGVSRGLVFAVAGGFVVQAAVRYDPDEAKGLDDSLRALASTPAGPWLLAAVAVGLALYGLLLFALAHRHRG
ncbi:DUF1206 domain-containing protein [Streptomyces sp. TRM43335]|uniref:DUF1206 domain-containing protein n=1 Tax=Streptomyces taklimakanensis TaxID=2569853 RepID=A0A6G2BI36_9ACTN|nr:DUF1206 domain-containing protein [Streptomyces taklimakanensis]MTE21723.1 DUF1206 domain-containing protein [Streptomyces taklimakanensis]